MTIYLNRTHLILFLAFFLIMVFSSCFLTARASVSGLAGTPVWFAGLTVLVIHPLGWLFLVEAAIGISLISALVAGTLLGVFRKP
jgi:hypothetical protein